MNVAKINSKIIRIGKNLFTCYMERLGVERTELTNKHLQVKKDEQLNPLDEFVTLTPKKLNNVRFITPRMNRKIEKCWNPYNSSFGQNNFG